MLNLAPKESSIEGYLQSRVKAMGGKCLKFTSPSNAGVPDRLCLFPFGVTAFIELKRLGETPKPLQAKFLRDAEKLGHIAGWADSCEAVDRLLREAQFWIERAA